MGLLGQATQGHMSDLFCAVIEVGHIGCVSWGLLGWVTCVGSLLGSLDGVRG